MSLLPMPNCNQPDHSKLPDLSSLRPNPNQFSDIYESERGKAIWKFLIRPDNIVRMQTATDLDRAAVEPLGKGLLAEFGIEVAEDRMKQFIGHATRQFMEALGYFLDRQGMRITGENMFASASRYRSRDQKTMVISPESRQKWMETTANSPFNKWLNAQVRKPHGGLDRDKLTEVAAQWGVDDKYKDLNPGQARMTIGIKLRAIVPAEVYMPKPDVDEKP
jgi:hypothetical protein